MNLSERFESVLAQARNLRDHMLRVGGERNEALVDALRPFQRDDGAVDPTDDEVRALYIAFQASHEEAGRLIDAYTLEEVLAGRSPYNHPARSGNSIATAALGILFVALALHFSFWANRVTYAIAEAESFTSVDHFAEVMRLAEFENFFDETVADAETKNLEPYLLYLEGIAALKIHYVDESRLPQRLRDLNATYNPISDKWQDLKRVICAPKERGAVQKLLCKAKSAVQRTAEAESKKTARPDGADGMVSSTALPAPDGEKLKQIRFQNRLIEVQDLLRDTMRVAGRDKKMPPEFGYSQVVVANYAQELTSKLNIVRRWWLPIVYGALGSVVYCMWRVLNPTTSPFGLLHVVLRTAFAGLAALTLSMLLIPSNALALGAETSRPFIYLVSFVFGYSIEAFVTTLNNLNAFLSTRLQPKSTPPPAAMG